MGDFQQALAGFLKEGVAVSSESQPNNPETRNAESRQVSADAVKNLTNAAAQVQASLLGVPLQGAAAPAATDATAANATATGATATNASAAGAGSASAQTGESQKADNKSTDPADVNGPKKEKDDQKVSGETTAVVAVPVSAQPPVTVAGIPGLPFFAGQQIGTTAEESKPAQASADGSKDAVSETPAANNNNTSKTASRGEAIKTDNTASNETVLSNFGQQFEGSERDRRCIDSAASEEPRRRDKASLEVCNRFTARHRSRGKRRGTSIGRCEHAGAEAV